MSIEDECPNSDFWPANPGDLCDHPDDCAEPAVGMFYICYEGEPAPTYFLCENHLRLRMEGKE